MNITHRKYYLLAILALVFSISGCLMLVSYRQETNFNAPDPAAVTVPVPGFGTYTQIYTTQNSLCGWPVGVNILTFAWNGQTVSGCKEALKYLPPHATNARVWAPTVRFVNNRYLLLYSGSADNHAANCIFGALAPRADDHFQPVRELQWCDPNSSVGWLDPQLFLDGTKVYLLWSIHNPADKSSRIVIQRLSNDGLSFLPSSLRYTLLSHSDIASYGGGSNSFIENPAMVFDTVGYNLFVSIGTWSDASYKTVMVLCESPTKCSKTPIPFLKSDNKLDGPGGLSFATDYASEPTAFFAARRTGVDSKDRVLWTARTRVFRAN